MKHSEIVMCCVLALGMLCAFPAIAHGNMSQKFDEKQHTEALIQGNLLQLKMDFPARCSTRIKHLIWEQLSRGKRETEATLGRAQVYFPIFEYYLSKYQLPEELKNIPFVESRLKINAESPAGAKGLWQLMDYTARQYKLQINEYVDERFDLMRSTDAAARLLSDLHREFGDWLLVLAAYNCGPGKVRKAIRRADCNNYWEIERYLPRQTQGYILSFISAAYVVAYAEQHGLKANPHAVEELSVLKIRDSIHLQGVAQAANLPLHTMRRLNPGYQQEVIPASRRGNYLILQADSLPSVQAMLRKQKVAFNFIRIWNQEKPTKAIAYTLPSLKPLLSAPLDWRFPFHFKHQYTQNNVELFLNPLKFFSQMA